MKSGQAVVRIEPWGEDDLPLLEKLMGDPAMTEHLGGPESPEKIRERQSRYEPPGSGMFKIVDETTGEAAGSVGYWERAWRERQVYEVGWSVLPAFQGRGFARLATAQVVALARAERKHRFLYAFPSIDNRRRTRSAAGWASRWSRSASSSTRPVGSCGATSGASTSLQPARQPPRGRAQGTSPWCRRRSAATTRPADVG